MRNILFAISVMLTSLLLFGCLGGSNTGQGAAQQNGTSGAQGIIENTSNAINNASQELKETTLETITALGMPYECTATVVSDGHAMESHYWVKGNNIRVEFTVPEVGGKQVMLVRDDGAYIKGGAGTVYSMFESVPGYEGCEWYFFPAENESKVITEVAPTPTYSPNVKVSCTPAVFGDEKFAVAGKVCNMKELLESIQKQMSKLNTSGGAAMQCSGLEGQALIDCLKNQ